MKGKYILELKYVTMVDPVTRWFEFIQYNYKKLMTVTNLVEMTRLIRYPWPIEIMFDQG